MSSQRHILDFPMPRESPFDPPPQILDLLEHRPVSRVRLWNGQESWLVTRYEDVKAVLQSKAFSSDVRTPGYPKVSESLATGRKCTVGGRGRATARTCTLAERCR